jgi:hypothetical protein
MEPVTTAALEAQWAYLLDAPRDRGTVELLVARPRPGARAVLDEATLDPELGLVGDCWRSRGSRHTPDGAANPLMQCTLMSARVIAAVAGPRDRWPLAGDQVYVDLDLSEANLPPGTRLTLGTALVEVTAQPHTGCAKFADRFGIAAARFVNSPEGRAHNFRGINARVVQAGVVRPGDVAEIRPG